MLLQLAGFNDDPYFAPTNGLSRAAVAGIETLPPALAHGLNAAAAARIQGSFCRLRQRVAPGARGK